MIMGFIEDILTITLRNVHFVHSFIQMIRVDFTFRSSSFSLKSNITLFAACLHPNTQIFPFVGIVFAYNTVFSAEIEQNETD